jgi:hypothetical protein
VILRGLGDALVESLDVLVGQLEMNAVHQIAKSFGDVVSEIITRDRLGEGKEFFELEIELQGGQRHGLKIPRRVSTSQSAMRVSSAPTNHATAFTAPGGPEILAIHA